MHLLRGDSTCTCSGSSGRRPPSAQGRPLPAPPARKEGLLLPGRGSWEFGSLRFKCIRSKFPSQVSRLILPRDSAHAISFATQLLV